MSRRDPFGFDISVSADKKKRARNRTKSGAVHTSERECDHPECKATAQFRAPRSPDDLENFLWFCKDHIREFNTRWNYFKDASPEELEAARNGSVWDRPTWSFKTGESKSGASGHPEGKAWQRFGYNDPFEALGDNATINRPTDDTGRRTTRRLPVEDRRAVAILGGDDASTKTELKKLYKSLVKDLHPDRNGGKRDEEDRLTDVLKAWDHVKQSRMIPE